VIVSQPANSPADFNDHGGSWMVLLGSRRRAEDLEVEVARLRAWLAELGAMDDMQRFERRQAADQQLACVLSEERAARDRVALAQQELAQL
jgi:hypothetical protein